MKCLLIGRLMITQEHPPSLMPSCSDGPCKMMRPYSKLLPCWLPRLRRSCIPCIDMGRCAVGTSTLMGLANCHVPIAPTTPCHVTISKLARLEQSYASSCRQGKAATAPLAKPRQRSGPGMDASALPEMGGAPAQSAAPRCTAAHVAGTCAGRSCHRCRGGVPWAWHNVAAQRYVLAHAAVSGAAR